MHDTLPRLLATDFPAIRRRRVTTLQMNLGYLCNLACTHCHVAAGPNRTELMGRETMETALEFMAAQGIETLDVTGGSPEMNPHFRWLVAESRRHGIHVMDRCNPTILEEPGYQWVAEFLAEHRIEVIASLPCYLEDNVDTQRGKGVFQSSVRALRRLNALGYGDPASGLVLNLVYNPVSPVLPPPQQGLEADYRAHLGEEFGLRFNNLFALANMPIKRFGSMLVSNGRFDDYLHLLRGAHRPANLANVMCRDLVSVDWRGYVYDCDFNQMLGLPLGAGQRRPTHLSQLVHRALEGAPISVADHCYGCTAGQGSSCGGALAPESEEAARGPWRVVTDDMALTCFNVFNVGCVERQRNAPSPGRRKNLARWPGVSRSRTAGSREAAYEPTGMYSRRVRERDTPGRPGTASSFRYSGREWCVTLPLHAPYGWPCCRASSRSSRCRSQSSTRCTRGEVRR